MKPYHPIKFKDNERIRFIKNQSGGRLCSFCEGEIKMNEAILTINYRAWFHLKCLEPLCNAILKFKKEITRELILEMLEG